MEETCLNSKADGQDDVDDINKDVSSEFNTAPDSQSIMEDKEHLQVYLRIRPFTLAESGNGESQDCVTIEPPDTVLLKPPSLSLSARLSSDKSLPQTGQRFQFSRVYGPETAQRELFEGTVKDLVKDVLTGGNSLVFTYGVTNAGKTFTFLGPDADAGILPRSLAVMFSSIDQRVFPGMSIKPHRCRDFTRLTSEQQAEEAAFKRNLFSQLKESDKYNASLLNSTNKTLLEGSFMLGSTAAAAEDRISLEMDRNTKFSVWVSFCEIYNENIHDLLEAMPTGAVRRTALRLSQDIKGNAFVKDLRWVQVDSAEEAYMVMKLGKKNQSFSSTRLNQLSSRSHSIFSIRILKIDDGGTPRVHTVSELCLCDLAGSERCAKTQNKGERLKEAGNINTSLLILGKCINALRHNQQAKLLQHVPFRESKLTHYLQGFFCGRGKACMIVNINQCASMYDETLNVLKFSAVAQKVVVLTSRPLPIKPKRSANDFSLVNNEAGRKGGRRSSLVGGDTSLEDVQEDEDDGEERSLMDDTMDQTDEEDAGEHEDKIIVGKRTHQRQVALLNQLQLQLKQEQADSLLMEARVREEISKEFSELFSEMQNDYNDRLSREREILEERAERRMEIFKNLIDKMATSGPGQHSLLDISLDSELAEVEKCLGSAQGDSGACVELERKVQQQTAHQHKGEARGEEDAERSRLLSELQQKGSEVTRLEGQVSELQKEAELKSQSHSCLGNERAGLQEALAALETEKRGREEALAALEYQTVGKEDALKSLEEEREAREVAVCTIGELTRSRDELQAALEEHRRHGERASADLQAQSKAKEDLMAQLRQEKRSREELAAALDEERSRRREVRSAVEQQEGTRSEEERAKLQQESDELRQQVRELMTKVEATEQQVSSETQRAAQACLQLQSAREEVADRHQELSALSLELHSLKEQQRAAAESSGEVHHQLRARVSELGKNVSEEKETNERTNKEALELRHGLAQAKEELARLTEELDRRDGAPRQADEELSRKLEEREQMWRQQLDQLRAQMDSTERHREELRTKLEDQTQASEKQVQELQEKLREREATSQQQTDELKRKLDEQNVTSERLLNDLKEKLREREQTTELLRAEVEEARCEGLKRSSSSAAVEDLKRLNSDFRAQVESLTQELSNMEQTQESLRKAEAQLVSSEETLAMLKEKERQAEAKLAEVATESAQRQTELQEKLREQEAQVRALQKSLKEAEEHKDEQESQALQEARRREVERRRELLAVAHEAIAQKDAELEKKAEEIYRLQESAQQDGERAKSLSLELQRREEDASELRDKLADYKKQVQQVQKEISAMREEERVLKLKLADAEKAKKQLQFDVANRDRSIQQLKLEQSSNTKSDQTLELYQKACKDLAAKEAVMEDMRLALTEQEETQDQMENVLEEKLNIIEELSSEVEKLKGMLLQQDSGESPHVHAQVDSSSAHHDVKQAKQEAARAQDSLKLCTDKHAADRKKWLEEKLLLIGQAKEAEDKRNREMRKFADDRERYTRQQSQLESMSSELCEKEQTMDRWRKERDALVSALEVQLQKLLSSQAEKDTLIKQLQHNNTAPPPERADGGVAELQASEKDSHILPLKEELKENTVTQTQSPVTSVESESIIRKSGGRRDRVSVISQSSSGCPSVLESSEISTENGRARRFPQPELEISFSPLQPNRMALRRQGDPSAVTVKITRSTRKRKSGEMDKSPIFRRSKRRTKEEEVEAENRRNTKTRPTLKLTPHKEEVSSGRHDSQSSLRSRKEGTLQKIGDFLQSSPTLLGSKAKKMMGLVSGRGDVDSAASSSSLSLRAMKNKRKPYRPTISSPMDMPSHPIISRDPEEKDIDHEIIKRRLRSRMAK